MKRKGKWILLVVLVVLAYELLGAIAPFLYQKKVSATLPSTQKFLGETYRMDTDRAAVIESNKEALELRLAMFAEAKERIVMTTFDIRSGESTSDVFAALVAAADRGVKVQVIVDGMYGMIHMNGKEIFKAAGSHKNIEIKYYNTPNVLLPWTINGRMHDKYILVDDQFLLMGGRNTFDYFLGEYEGKSIGYDREVLVYNQAPKEESVIASVENYFKRLWESRLCKHKFEGDEASYQDELATLRTRIEKRAIATVNWKERTVETRKVSFLSNPTHIYGKEPVVWETLQRLMAEADEKVVVHTPYAVFSKDMYRGMKEVAEKVPGSEMILNSIASGDNVCASSDYMHNKQKVVDTGMKLYEYMGKYSTHGKSVLIDDHLSVIGSYNFDNRSTYVDTETMLVVDSEPLAKELEGHFQVLKDGSLEVDANGEYLPKDGVKERTLSGSKEWQIRLLSYVMWLFRYLA